MRAADLAVIAAFLAATLWLGVRGGRRREKGGADEYFVAGRSLSLPTFVVTLVATWYGGVLGVGEYSYRFGISNWLVLGVPYYVGALLFAFIVAGKARASQEYTVPDLLFDHYGRAAGVVGTLAVLALSLPAAYLLMLGVLLRRMLGVPQPVAIAAATLFTVAYIALRGFRSVVETKGLQFALMYAGFALLLPIAVSNLGGGSFLAGHLPPETLTWDGGRGPGWVIAWYFIALQTLVEPTFFQRSYAARDARIARLGVLLAIPCFFLFDGLTTATGMYARAALPDLPSGVDAYPALAEQLLPAGLLGLFYVGMLATVMSTVDSFLLVGGVTLGRDLAWRLSDGRADQLRWSRAGVVLAAFAAAAVAIGSESVVALWYGFGSVGTAVLLFPLLGALYPGWRSDRRLVAPAMLLSGGATLFWLLLGGPDGPWLGIEPIYPGLALAALFAALGIVLRGSRPRGSGPRSPRDRPDRGPEPARTPPAPPEHP